MDLKPVKVTVYLPTHIAVSLGIMATAEAVSESRIVERVLEEFFGVLAPEERRRFLRWPGNK